jgi:uroporphyrinogen decarboxylase
LSEATTIEDLNTYEFPDPCAEIRVEGLEERAQALQDYCLILEGLREPVFGTSSWIRGHTQFYMDLVSDNGFATAFLDRMLDFQLKLTSFLLEKIGDSVDIVKVGDDLGTQANLIISPRTYRKLIKPRQEILYKHIKEKGHCKLLLHSCGAIRKIIPDLIEIGVDALNPVQITAEGMEPALLKKDFGDKITFWGGGIDTQDVLPRGNPKQVREHVKKSLEAFKEGGGYVFAQVHNILPEVPVENIIAMYDAYREFAPY